MRYLSLRIVSLIYKVSGVLGAILTFALFIMTASGGASIAQVLGLNFGVQAATTGYWFSFFFSFVILISGLIGSVTSYAFGAFIMLMIDVEAGVRSIDQHFYRADYPADNDPITPKPLASFPPSRYSGRTPPPPGYDERLREYNSRR